MRMKMQRFSTGYRRDVAAAACAASLALTLLWRPARADDTGPIRIGAPVALSGPLATVSGALRRAVDFAVAQANAKGGINGRKIEVRYADTEGTPDVSRRQVEKLALEGYNLLVGTNSTSEGLAVGPMLRRVNAVLVSPFASGAQLTAASCQARFFRTNQSDPMQIAAARAWLQTRPEKKWITIATDFAFGHSASDGFDRAAKSLDKEVAASLFAPLGTTDFAPYIQQIRSAGIDGVFVMMSNQDAVNFVTQSKQFGILGNKLMAGLIYTQDDITSAVGPDTVGLWGNIDYSFTLDTPENKAFVAAWKAMYNGDNPQDSEGKVYDAITTLLQAIQKAGSADPAAVAKALSGGTFSTVFGNETIRAEDHQMLVPEYYGQVKLVDGKPHMVVSLELSPEQAAPPVDPGCKL